jgi:hypothetical protein
MLGLLFATALPGCTSSTAALQSEADLCAIYTNAENEETLDHRLTRESATNQAGTYRAVILCEPLPQNPDACQDRLLVQNLAVGETKAVGSDCFLPWRPLSDLSWVTDTLLEFDQWATPDYGHHFEVDVETDQLLKAEPIATEKSDGPEG